jgi:hypothetical protein
VAYASVAPPNLLDRALSPAQARWFFLLALLAFVLPFILADYRYVDDNWRAQLDVQSTWRHEGRLLVELFYRALTFSGLSIDVFPLPLLLACAAMAWALAALVRHYYAAPRLGQCLVVLPLWYSPLYLGNLTYQYDGPTMTLSLAAVIYAVIYRHRSWPLAVLLPGCLLAVALALYQVTVNVFIGLCCVELIRATRERLPGGRVWALVGRQLGQLLIGVLLYYLSAYQLMLGDRQGMLTPDASGLGELALRLGVIVHSIGLFVTAGNGWMWAAVALLAALGYVWIGLRLLFGRGLVALGSLLPYLAAVPVLALSVGGMILPFADFTLEARTLMGFSPVLLALFYLAHFSLTRLRPRLEWLLAIPLLCMLSLSFVYGRVLQAQKTLETMIYHDLHHDLTSAPELRDLGRFYWSSTQCVGTWLPALSGTLAAQPGLSFVLSLGPCNLAIPEHMTDLDLQSDDSLFEQLMVKDRGRQVVHNRYYDIWVLNGYGYVAMKPVDDTPKPPSW